MHPILNRSLYFVKEHVGAFKAVNNFDILDPKTSQEILHCREEGLNFFTRMLRFSDYKRMTPFSIVVRTTNGEPVLTVRRGWTFWRSKVEVLDENGELIGRLRQRMLSVGGKFEILDPEGNLLCMLKGKWTSWNFSFTHQNREFARVNKKWAGLGKELFTTADNYMLEIQPHVQANHPIRTLILAAVMCIDMVLKE